MRRIIALALSCAVITAGAATVYGAEYTDVNSNHWAFKAVKTMSDQDIIKGYPGGSFQPDRTVTCGEFIKMALIASTGKDPGNAASGHWASTYYSRALELGYFTEYDIQKEGLSRRITRAHMALIISSILGDVKIENYDKIQEGITDITFKTPYEYDITKAYAAGILTGYTDHTFRPDQTLSRAESAAVIHRLVDEGERRPPGSDSGETKNSAVLTYPTSELLDMSKLTPDKTIAVSVRFTDEYELYTDAREFMIQMFRDYNGESCAFDHTLRGHIYLIKNGEIVEYCSTGPMYDEEGLDYLGFQRSRAEYDISKADYIICVPSNAKSDAEVLIKAVVNPFKL